MDVVLVIDHDEEVRQALADSLRSGGFEVIEAAESHHGLTRMMVCDPQAIVMNEAMPPVGEEGLLSLLRELTQAPIIVIGTGGEEAMLQAVLQGADAYLTRPVRERELLARVRALLRRWRWQSVANRGFSLNINLDEGQFSEIVAGLSRTEARLFSYLAQRGDRMVPQQELVTGVWGDQGKDTSLRFYISQLRSKLAQMQQIAYVEILNLKRGGYMLRVSSSNSTGP